MMYITLNQRARIVFLIFTTIITLTFCESETPAIDYDLPAVKSLHDYVTYHFNPPSRYGQEKLEPLDFYMSIYNPKYFALPHPKQIINYENYLKEFNQKKENINFEVLETQISNAKISEQDKNDERYLYANPNHYWNTDPMYYESNIYTTHLQTARKYIDHLKPLSPTSYGQITMFYSLLPKSYEKSLDFYKARYAVLKQNNLVVFDPSNNLFEGVEGIDFLKEITPNYAETVGVSGTSLETNNASVRFYTLLNSNYTLRGDTYEDYLIRLSYQEIVPLHPEVCNKTYDGVNYENDSFDEKNPYTSISDLSRVMIQH